MRALLFFFLMLGFSQVFAQTWYLSNETGIKLDQIEKQTAAQALWAVKVVQTSLGITEELYKSGSLYERKELLYKDDILIQSRTYRYGTLIVSKSFLNDGKLLEETNYSDSEKKGKRKFLYGPMGLTGCEFYSLDGRLEYTDSYILDKDGRISFIFRSADGIQQEYFKYSYDAGILRSFIHQNGGQLSYILYNQKQQSEKEIVTLDGKIVRAVYNEYSSDFLSYTVLTDTISKKKVETEYNSLQLPVVQREYALREDGNANLLVRTEYEYNEAKDMVLKTQYADGVKTETHYEYDGTGELMTEKEFRDGNLFKTDTYQGDSMERKLFHEGLLYVTIQFENGKKISEVFNSTQTDEQP